MKLHLLFEEDPKAKHKKFRSLVRKFGDIEKIAKEMGMSPKEAFQYLRNSFVGQSSLYTEKSPREALLILLKRLQNAGIDPVILNKLKEFQFSRTKGIFRDSSSRKLAAPGQSDSDLTRSLLDGHRLLAWSDSQLEAPGIVSKPAPSGYINALENNVDVLDCWTGIKSPWWDYECAGFKPHIPPGGYPRNTIKDIFNGLVFGYPADDVYAWVTGPG